MPKAQPKVQLMSIKTHILSISFPIWDSRFLPHLITSSSEHRKHQFLIHSMLSFQQSPTWIEIDNHNANDDANTERVEEKLLYQEK